MSVHFTVEYVHFLHHRFNKYVYLILFLENFFQKEGTPHFQNTFPFSERKYVRTPFLFFSLIADWSISMDGILDFIFRKTFFRIRPFPLFKILFPERKKVRTPLAYR